MGKKSGKGKSGKSGKGKTSWKNHGEDKRGAEKEAERNRADGKNSWVDSMGHETGTGKYDVDYLVGTKDE